LIWELILKREVEVIVRFSNKNRVSYLHLPLKKRAITYRAHQEALVKKVIRIGGFRNPEIFHGWYQAPNCVRGRLEVRKIPLLRKIKGVIVHRLPTEKERRRIANRLEKPEVYWGLLCSVSQTAGVKRADRFYFSIAVKAANGKQAERQVKTIAKHYSGISVDHKFRKVVSRTEVLLVECCETQWGWKQPDHLVLMRTSQRSRTSLSIKALIEQAVPLY